MASQVRTVNRKDLTMNEQPQKTAWHQPQNYIIAILLLGIAGYVSYQQLQPKPNRLAQASLYFDALEAEERATAALQQAEQARQQAAIARQQADTERRQREQAEQQARNQSRALASNWTYQNHDSCGHSFNVFSCNVLCVNGAGQSHRLGIVTVTRLDNGGWSYSGQILGSMVAAFQAACASL
jgi:multidrug efflux pump subunit AcrA (membrane-fusion protein)